MSKIIDKLKELRLPRMPVIKHSTTGIILLLVSASIFILGGGVYDIMEKPISVLPTPSQPVFYYPGMTDQTLTESLTFMFYLLIGISGGYISFRSTRFFYRPREARMYLLIGVTMMIFSFIGCETLSAAKGV